MTVLVVEQVIKPTNKKQEGVLNEDHDLWSEVSRESVSRWSSCELDYDLSRWEPEEYEYLKRVLKRKQRHDLFDLVSRKTSISRRTSVAGSPLPTRMPSMSAVLTTDKRKISPTTYETVTQGSSIKHRTECEKLMMYIPQQLQRLIEKIDNPSKDELIRKHLSAELKKDKKMYEMIEGRNIDKDIRNT
ncbi:hypothetical protein PPACK8108_LOCUS7870 [Phakopsora pachyrhizi]|uniref:Uncharacterized protein n=1 Tax=Phakopsora pachyrhizi TaxID=170000 RepID=A0AAV0ATR8_PHAPC|nr:hypothetical protein PPACK8108_LOCUS7870 [Phakopsora pachyrhizi]